MQGTRTGPAALRTVSGRVRTLPDIARTGPCVSSRAHKVRRAAAGGWWLVASGCLTGTGTGTGTGSGPARSWVPVRPPGWGGENVVRIRRESSGECHGMTCRRPDAQRSRLPFCHRRIQRTLWQPPPLGTHPQNAQGARPACPGPPCYIRPRSTGDAPPPRHRRHVRPSGAPGEHAGPLCAHVRGVSRTVLGPCGRPSPDRCAGAQKRRT